MWGLARRYGKEGGGWGRTGYVLGEELAALGGAFGAARGEGVPERGNEDVVVEAGVDGDVLHGGVADFGAVAEELYVHVGYCGGIFCWVCDV